MHISDVRHRTMQFAVASFLLSCVGGMSPVQAAGTVGSGTPASCTEAAFDTALTGGGAVDFNCGAAPATIVLTATKSISASTTIDGGGLITLDGNNAVREFFLSAPATVQFVALSLVNGNTASYGAAVYADVGTTIGFSHVAFDNNQSALGGGAIFAADAATLTLDHVTASNNLGTNGGGAIMFWGAALTITDSTFSANAAAGFGAAGGAIEVNPITTATVSIANSTFSGNGGGAGTSGGAISMRAVPNATINNSTFADNAAGTTLSIYNNSTASLTNSIVSATVGGQNCAASPDSTIVDGGNNLQFGGSVSQSCGANVAEIDPQLGALANNGGFADTMALPAGSPAIDAGNNATCAAMDERDVARPIGASCDIGAFEAAATAIAPTFTNAPPSGGTIGVAYAFSFTATGGAPISFSLASGLLPTGLVLSAGGVLSGIPTATGTFNGTISASNGTAPDATQAFSITIVSAAPQGGSATMVPTPALGAWALAFLIVMLGSFAGLRTDRR